MTTVGLGAQCWRFRRGSVTLSAHIREGARFFIFRATMATAYLDVPTLVAFITLGG